MEIKQIKLQIQNLQTSKY